MDERQSETDAEEGFEQEGAIETSRLTGKLVLRFGVGGCDCVLPRRGVNDGFPTIRSKKSRLEFLRSLLALELPLPFPTAGLRLSAAPLPTPPMPLSWSESSATDDPSPASHGLTDLALPFCWRRVGGAVSGSVILRSGSWTCVSCRDCWLFDSSRPSLFSRENDGIAELGIILESKI